MSNNLECKPHHVWIKKKWWPLSVPISLWLSTSLFAGITSVRSSMNPSGRELTCGWPLSKIAVENRQCWFSHHISELKSALNFRYRPYSDYLAYCSTNAKVKQIFWNWNIYSSRQKLYRSCWTLIGFWYWAWWWIWISYNWILRRFTTENISFPVTWKWRI